MRKLIGIVLLGLLLSGCAGNAPAATTDTNTAAATPAGAGAAPLAGGDAAGGDTAATTAPAATEEVAGAAPLAGGDAAATTAPAGDTAATTAPGATEVETTAAGGAQATTAPGGAETATAAPGGAPAAPGGAPAVAAGNRLQVVRDRGQLICGANAQLPGFGSVDAQGNFTGFDVDFCRGIAAAVFGDATKVQFRPLTAQERFTAVQTGEVDVLARNTTWTTSRDTTVGLDFAPINFFDGQGMMVRKADNITTLEDMNGASICVQSGTTTELNLADNFRARNLEFTPVVFEDADATTAAYDEGRCDGFTTDKSGLASSRLKLQAPDEHVILDVTMSKEPLAPSVLQGDSQWKDIVTWVVFGLITAEEAGITQQNVDTFLQSEDPNVRRLLGAEGELGAGLGLSNDFMVNVIRAVGNYGEIYDRHLGPNTPVNIPRGQNALYTEGGLLYAPPFR